MRSTLNTTVDLVYVPDGKDIDIRTSFFDRGRDYKSYDITQLNGRELYEVAKRLEFPLSEYPYEQAEIARDWARNSDTIQLPDMEPAKELENVVVPEEGDVNIQAVANDSFVSDSGDQFYVYDVRTLSAKNLFEISEALDIELNRFPERQAVMAENWGKNTGELITRVQVPSGDVSVDEYPYEGGKQPMKFETEQVEDLTTKELYEAVDNGQIDPRKLPINERKRVKEYQMTFKKRSDEVMDAVDSERTEQIDPEEDEEDEKEEEVELTPVEKFKQEIPDTDDGDFIYDYEFEEEMVLTSLKTSKDEAGWLRGKYLGAGKVPNKPNVIVVKVQLIDGSIEHIPMNKPKEDSPDYEFVRILDAMDEKLAGAKQAKGDTIKYRWNVNDNLEVEETSKDAMVASRREDKNDDDEDKKFNPFQVSATVFAATLGNAVASMGGLYDSISNVFNLEKYLSLLVSGYCMWLIFEQPRGIEPALGGLVICALVAPIALAIIKATT